MIKNIAIIAIMLGFVASVVFLDVPIIQNVLSSQKEIENKEQTLIEKEAFIKTIEGLIEKYENSKEVFKNLDIILPGDSDVPNLIVQIEAMVNQSGMKMSDIDIATADQKELSKASAARNKGDTSQEKVVSDYKIIAVDLMVNGDYIAFKKFLQTIEENMRLMNIESITFSQESQQSSGSTFEFNVILNTYYYAN